MSFRAQPRNLAFSLGFFDFALRAPLRMTYSTVISSVVEKSHFFFEILRQAQNDILPCHFERSREISTSSNIQNRTAHLKIRQGAAQKQLTAGAHYARRCRLIVIFLIFCYATSTPLKLRSTLSLSPRIESMQSPSVPSSQNVTSTTAK